MSGVGAAEQARAAGRACRPAWSSGPASPAARRPGWRRSRPTPARSSSGLVAARNDCVPPKQKPTVTTARAPVRSRSACIAAAVSAWTCSTRGLQHVRPVVEVVVARREAGGAAEVVDHDRVVAGLREALGQLDVERGTGRGRRAGSRRRLRWAAATRPAPRRSAFRRRRSAPAAPPGAAGERGRARSAGSSGGRASNVKHMARRLVPRSQQTSRPRLSPIRRVLGGRHETSGHPPRVMRSPSHFHTEGSSSCPASLVCWSLPFSASP